MKKIVVGISSCLLGQEVRYDGGHKYNSYIERTLGQYFEFRPFCPEVEAGSENQMVNCLALAFKSAIVLMPVKLLVKITL